MPSMRHHNHGNLYIQFEVVFPPNKQPDLNLSERETLRKFLGLPYKSEKQLLEEKIARQKARVARRKAEEHEQTKKGMILDKPDPALIAIKDAEEEADFVRNGELDPEHTLPTFTKETIVEDHELHDVDQNGQYHANGATMEDEEEEGMHQGGERVQCASQ